MDSLLFTIAFTVLFCVCKNTHAVNNHSVCVSLKHDTPERWFYEIRMAKWLYWQKRNDEMVIAESLFHTVIHKYTPVGVVIAVGCDSTNVYINEIQCRSRFGLANRLWSCSIGSNDDAIVCVFRHRAIVCVSLLCENTEKPKDSKCRIVACFCGLPHRAFYPLLSRFTLFVFGKPIVRDVCRKMKNTD